MKKRLSHTVRSAFVSTLAIAAALPGLARAEAPRNSSMQPRKRAC